MLGDRPKSAEAMTADIAAIRLYNYLNCRLEQSLIEICSHLRDCTVAASYFHQLAPFYSKDGWSHLEMSMLDMYAQCLKLIGRDDDYVRIGLKMIAKLADMDRMASGDQLMGKAMSFSLTDLVSASRLLVQPILVPIESYFGSIALDPYPRPYDDHDGFQLQLRVRNLTFVAIEAHHIQIKIVSVQDYQHSELFLTASGIHCLQPGTANILVGTNVRKGTL